MTILRIDRSKPFNHSLFGGWEIKEKGSSKWHNKVWRELIVPKDENSIFLSEVDLSRVTLETMLENGEKFITWEEKGKRLKQLQEQGGILLDIKVFEALTENPSLYPESWKENMYWWETRGMHPPIVFFDGTELSTPRWSDPIGMQPSVIRRRRTLALGWDTLWTKGGGLAYSSSTRFDVSTDTTPSAVLWPYPIHSRMHQ